MTLTHYGPHTSLASFRAPGEPFPVRSRGLWRRRADEVSLVRLEAAEAAVALFSSEWSLAAASVSSVEIVPEIYRRGGASPNDLAFTCTGVRLGRVQSRIQVLASLFTNSGPDLTASRGDIVASGIKGVFWHEFGHVLLNTLVLRAEPLSRSAEAGAQVVVAEALGSATTVSVALAGSKLSVRAQMSCEELVAEAVSDFGVHGHDAHPVSVGIVMVLAELWHSD